MRAKKAWEPMELTYTGEVNEVVQKNDKPKKPKKPKKGGWS